METVRGPHVNSGHAPRAGARRRLDAPRLIADAICISHPLREHPGQAPRELHPELVALLGGGEEGPPPRVRWEAVIDQHVPRLPVAEKSHAENARVVGLSSHKA
eukprot:scaffold101942_cov28-Tisochrysis_lutea.AAC.2